MRKITRLSKVALLTIGVLCALSNVSSAATYTAVASGNWSNSVIWGGTGPGFYVTANNSIVIPSGITVTLDQNLALNGNFASLSVEGSLTGSTRLVVLNGILTGSGTVSLAYLDIGTAGSITSAGSVTVNEFTNSTTLLTLSTPLYVRNMITLVTGTVQLNAGGVLHLSDNGTLQVGLGTVNLNGGNVDIAGIYNLTYLGFASTMGIEATFPGLRNITVDLASPLSVLNMSGDLTVPGKLTLEQGRFNVGANRLTINGAINSFGYSTLSVSPLSKLVINGYANAGSLAFTSGASTIGSLDINISGNTGSFTLLSDLAVSGALNLYYGSLQVGSNLLTLSGSITGPGTLGTTINSNIEVSGSGDMGSLKLSGGGNVNDISLNISSNGLLSLKSNLIVNGNLSVTNGMLMLNGYDLTINGTVDIGASGALSGNTGSDVIIHGSGDIGNLAFNPLSNSIKNLTVNIASSGYVSLSSDLDVSRTLSVTEGTVRIGNYDLSVARNGNMQGCSASGYVVTNGIGRLVMNLNNRGTSVTFPVGTMTDYAPVVVSNYSSSEGSFKVKAHHGIFAYGTSGADISSSQGAVNTSWDIETDIAAGLNANVELFWSIAMEVNGFDRSNAYLSHFAGVEWDAIPVSAASWHDGGLYSLKRTELTSLSPFAVFDHNAITAIPLVTDASGVNVYPNPATDHINLFVSSQNKFKEMRIIDAIGNIVSSINIVENITSLDISRYPQGFYFISVDNVIVRKFIKS